MVLVVMEVVVMELVVVVVSFDLFRFVLLMRWNLLLVWFNGTCSCCCYLTCFIFLLVVSLV